MDDYVYVVFALLVSYVTVYEMVVCILVLLRLCGVVCGFAVFIQHFIENGHLEAQDGGIVGVSSPLSSGPTFSPLTTLYEYSHNGPYHKQVSVCSGSGRYYGKQGNL